MKIGLYVVICTCFIGKLFSGEPLSKIQLERIVNSRSDGKPLIGALQIYSGAKSYDINFTTRFANGKEILAKATSVEKIINGRYIISTIHINKSKASISMVVEYDEKSKTYRKYVMTGGEIKGY